MEKFEVISDIKQVEKAINKLAGGHLYRVTDEYVNPDEHFQQAEHLYLANPANGDFPVPAPLYFAVDVAWREGCDCSCPCPPGRPVAVTQTVWSDPDGDIRRRLGAVTHEEGQEPAVAWGQWKAVSGPGGCDCPPRRVLTADTDFYISKDGNDDTGDGLTEATALATWEGFMNRWIFNEHQVLDINGHGITINFGPGQWTGELKTSSSYFLKARSVTIKGVGIGQTIFSNPDGYALYFEGPMMPRFYVNSLSAENSHSGLLAYQAWINIRDLKFKNVGKSATGNVLLASNYGRIHTDTSDGPVNLYMEGFKGGTAFASQYHGSLFLMNCKVTLSDTCSWVYFARPISHGLIEFTNFSHQGSGTGGRFFVSHHGMITGTGGNQSFLPGSIAGIIHTASFGLYN